MRQLVSVIVPIYKVEKYIHRCVDSIINQTYSNLEIILVDDGSPDSCGAICDEYARTDNRIVVVHKANGGLSDARNAGLDIMHGYFVTFVDSDDYIYLDYVEKLYKAINDNDADISVCAEEYVLELSNGKEKVIKRPFREYEGTKILTVEEALSCSLMQDLFEASAWAKLYRANLFSDVRYPVGFAYEDQGTTYKTFLKSERVAFLGEHLYCYLQRNGSILHSGGSSKRFWDGIQMVEKQYKDVIEVFPSLEQSANSRLLSMYFHAFIGGIHTNDRALIDLSWNGIKTRRSIQNLSKSRTKLLVAIVLSYLGENAFMVITKLLYK